METAIRIYVINKAIEFAKKNIYRSEIVNKGKEGLEKFNDVVEKFWDNAEFYIMKEKEVDRKFIPDVIEQTGEEAVQEVIRTLREELDPKKLVQDIFDTEKTENPEIF